MNVRVAIFDRSTGARLIDTVVEAENTCAALASVLGTFNDQVLKRCGSLSASAVCVDPRTGSEFTRLEAAA